MEVFVIQLVCQVLNSTHRVPVDCSCAGSGIGPFSCSAIGMVLPTTLRVALYSPFWAPWSRA